MVNSVQEQSRFNRECQIDFFVVCTQLSECSIIPTRLLPVYGISYNRKEVFHPQVLLRIPCYDLSPIIGFALGPQKRGTSGTPNFRALTGGEYKTQEHIHRTIADMRLLAIPTSRGRVADLDPN